MKLQGMTGVKGLARGPAKIWTRSEIADSTPHAEIKDIEGETHRLEETLARAGRELDRIIQFLEKEGRREEAQIIRFQQMLLMDPEIIQVTKELISTERLPGETAFVQIMGREVSNLLQEDKESVGEDYFARRASDYQDLINRVQRVSRGEHGSSPSLHRDCILISDDLNPTEMIQLLATQRVRALALEKGGATSHSVLIASARNIPTVLGLGDGIKLIHDGDHILVNGDQGEVTINPTAQQSAAFDRRLDEVREDRPILERTRNLPAATTDGCRVHLEANVGCPEEVDQRVVDQIDGIGVWRTEFLFLDRDTGPDEEEQVRIYRSISIKMAAKPVNIRTLDAGGEKNLPFLVMPRESNPDLGMRGIRLGLKHQGILKRQLRAILRANTRGNLRVMLPMISRIEEVEAVRALLDQCRQELMEQGHEINHDLPVGIMVEVPSTAMGLDLFIPLVDFFSLGTNDLIQYLLASDRQSEALGKIYSPFYPSIIRLLKQIVQIARDGNRPLSICGEMATRPLAIPLLLGLGFERLSVPPVKLIETKSLIRRLNLSQCQETADQILHMARRSEIEQDLASLLKESKHSTQ